MKRIIVVATIVLFLLIAGIGYFMWANTRHIEREILVNATPSVIIEEMEEDDDMELSSPWNKEVPESRIKVVSFRDFGAVYYTDLKIERQGDSSRVKLIFDDIHEDFGTRLSWIFRSRRIGDKYEAGLAKLKEVVEGRK